MKNILQKTVLLLLTISIFASNSANAITRKRHSIGLSTAQTLLGKNSIFIFPKQLQIDQFGVSYDYFLNNSFSLGVEYNSLFDKTIGDLNIKTYDWKTFNANLLLGYYTNNGYLFPTNSFITPYLAAGLAYYHINQENVPQDYTLISENALNALARVGLNFQFGKYLSAQVYLQRSLIAPFYNRYSERMDSYDQSLHTVGASVKINFGGKNVKRKFTAPKLYTTGNINEYYQPMLEHLDNDKPQMIVDSVVHTDTVVLDLDTVAVDSIVSVSTIVSSAVDSVIDDVASDTAVVEEKQEKIVDDTRTIKVFQDKNQKLNIFVEEGNSLDIEIDLQREPQQIDQSVENNKTVANSKAQKRAKKEATKEQQRQQSETATTEAKVDTVFVKRDSIASQKQVAPSQDSVSIKKKELAPITQTQNDSDTTTYVETQKKKLLRNDYFYNDSISATMNNAEADTVLQKMQPASLRIDTIVSDDSSQANILHDSDSLTGAISFQRVSNQVSDDDVVAEKGLSDKDTAEKISSEENTPKSPISKQQIKQAVGESQKPTGGETRNNIVVQEKIVYRPVDRVVRDTVYIERKENKHIRDNSNYRYEPNPRQQQTPVVIREHTREVNNIISPPIIKEVERIDTVIVVKRDTLVKVETPPQVITDTVVKVVQSLPHFITDTVRIVEQQTVVKVDTIIQAPEKDMMWTIYFANGQQKLTQANKYILDNIVSILADYKTILIEGNTDKSGSASLNERISKVRAESVKQYLVTKGVPTGKLWVKAYGEKFATKTNAPKERNVVVRAKK